MMGVKKPGLSAAKLSAGIAFGLAAMGTAGGTARAEDVPETGSAAKVVLDDIIVSATRTERPRFETPVASTVVGREDIESVQPLSFQDVFETVPGVEITGGARRISEEPNIRGFSDSQVVMRVDGARRNFDLGHRGRFFLDPDLVSRVEVARGAISTLYGSGAIGGAIDITTIDAEEMLRDGEDWGARLRGGYQGNGNEPLGAASFFTELGRVDALASFLYRESFEDLEDGAGNPILDTQDQVRNGLAKLGIDLAPGHRVELGFDLYDSKGQNPTNANAVSSATTVVNRDTQNTDFRFRYDMAPEGSPWLDARFVAYYTDLELTEDRIFDGRLDESEFSTWGVDFKNTFTLNEGKDFGVKLTLGGEAFEDEQSGMRDGAPRAQFPDAERRFLAAFAQAEIALFNGRVDIIPGIRFDDFKLETNGANPDRSESEVSPRISVGFAPADGVYLWGGWAKAFRAPSLTELYTDGVHFSAELAPGQIVVNEFVPNPDLEPEIASTFEIGGRLRGNGLFSEGDYYQVELGAHRSEVEDFIEQQVIFISGAPTFIPPFGPLVFPGETRTANVDATLKGLELSAEYETGRFRSVVSGHMLDGKNDTTDETLGSLIQDRISILGEVYFPNAGVRAGARGIFAFDRNGLPDDVNSGEDYQTFDLFAAWQPHQGVLKNTTVRLAIDNVTDETYSVFPSEVHNPGRSVRVSLTQRFGGAY